MGSFVVVFVVGINSKRKIEKFVNVVVQQKKRELKFIHFFFSACIRSKRYSSTFGLCNCLCHCLGWRRCCHCQRIVVRWNNVRRSILN